MNKVADFITEEIFKCNIHDVTIDVFSEVLKTIPHLRIDNDSNELLFTDEEVRKIRKVIGFFVSAQFGNHFMAILGSICRGDKGMDRRKMSLQYFTSTNELAQFIEICDILDIHVDTTFSNGIAELIIRKKEDFGRNG